VARMGFSGYAISKKDRNGPLQWVAQSLSRGGGLPGSTHDPVGARWGSRDRPSGRGTLEPAQLAVLVSSCFPCD
jgi:hypothetical protein